MGFGILLFGYTMLIEYGITVSSKFNIGIDIFPDILGYFLMFYATRKLSPYSQGFKNARFMSILMMVLGAATLILPIAALFQKGLPIISTALQYCYFTRDIFVFIFSVFVFALPHTENINIHCELHRRAKELCKHFVLNFLLYCASFQRICLV